jgi:UDP-glucose 4-epimerase
MNVIVTGGGGFIGSNLIDFLLNEKKIKKIIIIDIFNLGFRNINHLKKNKKVKIVKKDINKIKATDANFRDIDCVFHLAALADIVPSIVNPKKYCESNIYGTINILEAMRFHNVKRIIYTASASCYGLPVTFPTAESDKIDLQYPYAFTKYIGEQAVVHWSKVYGIEYISLRLFNVYGLRSRTSGAYGAVMGVFLKQKLENKKLTVVGNGSQSRDFINVKDVCKAYIKASKTKKINKIINIGSSKPIKVLTLAKMISGKIQFIPKRPGEPDISMAKIDNAKKFLGWKPSITFKNGIMELLKNIHFWKKAPLWNKSKIKSATKIWFKYLN